MSASQGQVTTSTTCDSSYSENDNCAFYTFGCSDLNKAVASFPLCFSGTQQSPINLDREVATVSDPGILTFTHYDSLPPLPLVLRVTTEEGFSLRLDFDQTMFRMGTGKKEKPKLKSNKKRKEQGKKKRKENSKKRVSRKKKKPKLKLNRKHKEQGKKKRIKKGKENGKKRVSRSVPRQANLLPIITGGPLTDT